MEWGKDMFSTNELLVGSAFFLAIVLIVAALFVLSKRHALKRKNEIRDFCLARGFAFLEDEGLLSGVWGGDFSSVPAPTAPSGFLGKLKGMFSPGSAPLGFTGLKIFNDGFGRKAGNIITLPFGKYPVLFLDYEYSESSGDSTVTYSYTVAAVKAPSAIPAFELRPEHFGDKLMAMAGFDDIDIPGFEEFSKKYCLKGPDKNSVLIFFAPQVVMALEKTDGWRIQCSGNYFAFFKKSGYVPAADYPSFIEDVKGLLAALDIKGRT